MTLTDTLALIGALTGTIALLWDFFKWSQTGVKVLLRISPNMTPFGFAEEEFKSKLNLFVEVTNTGDKKVTITHLVLTYYDSFWKRVLKRSSKNFIVLNPLPGQLPQLIDIGDRWVGLIEQSQDLEKMAKNGYLYVGINHSSSAKTLLKRVKINILENQESSPDKQ